MTAATAFETAGRAISSGSAPDVRDALLESAVSEDAEARRAEPLGVELEEGVRLDGAVEEGVRAAARTRRTTGVTSTSPVSQRDRRASARRRAREKGCWLSRRKSPRGKRPRRRATREGARRTRRGRRRGMHRDGRLRTRAVGDAEEAAQRMRRGGTAENPRHVIRGKRRAGRWETRRCSSPFVGRRGRVTGRDLDRARRRCASPRGACGSRRDARLAEAAGMTAREVPTGAFHARCRKRNDRSRMRRWLVCHANSANQLPNRSPAWFQQTHRGRRERSARPRAADRLSSSAASRASTGRPVHHSPVRLRFLAFDTSLFAGLFDAPRAPSEEPAPARAFPRVVAASSSFPSRNMRMAVSA